MKKLAFVIGLGLGFILGSKAGSGPYRELEDKYAHFEIGQRSTRQWNGPRKPPTTK